METPLATTHQIHGVQPVMPVPDVAAAGRWFCSVLGFQIDFEIGEPPNYARVRLGDHSFGDPVYSHLRKQVAGDGPPCGETRLHAGHDIDGLHDHVVSVGGDVVSPPADQPWGLREITLRAPGGYLIVIGAEIVADDAAATNNKDGPRTVFVVYRAKAGSEAALLDHIRRHVPLLQRLGLATVRAPFVMRGAGGVLLEVFEWASEAASRRAHHEAEVQAAWARFAELCTFEALSSLPEAAKPFAHFEAL